MLTSKKLLETFDKVNDTPLIEIEAFSIKNLHKFLSKILKRTSQVLSKKNIFFTIAVVSTCP